MKRCFLLFVLFFFSLIHSQDLAYRFINFSEKDGVPDKFIYSVSQDKKNRIWLGTQSGLYLFDGVKFNNIKSDKDIAGHQISNILQNVFVDSSGEIWL